MTSDNPVMTVKGTDTPVQVSSRDFAVQSDGTMAARGGGSTTMADVLTSRGTGGARRRRLLMNCANGTVNNQNCQDDSFVTQWQTALKLTVSPTTCYFRTWEFKRASGACYNWYAPGKNFNNIMGRTAYPGNTITASFPIASSTFVYDTYSFLTVQEIAYYAADGTLVSTDWSAPQFEVYCNIATINLVPTELGSGSISIYTTCLPPDAGICPDGGRTSCAVNYVGEFTALVSFVVTCSPLANSRAIRFVLLPADYTEFVPGTVTNPCFSTPGAIVGADVNLPTGTTGCHEYFQLLAGTSQSADTQNLDIYGEVDMTDMGFMPSMMVTGASPYIPSPPVVQSGHRRHVLAGATTRAGRNNPPPPAAAVTETSTTNPSTST